MNLADVIAAKVAGAANTSSQRIGVIAAVHTDLVDVRLQGVVHENVRYLDGYVPHVGDSVLLSAINAQWAVLGKLSRGQSAAQVQQLYTDPAERWVFADYGGPPWGAAELGQGRYPPPFTAPMRGIWIYGPLIPPGGSILSAKLTITASASASLAFPRITAHGYSAVPAGAPSWLYGPISPGSIVHGQSATFDIPPAWWGDIETGVILGFGLTSDAAADLMRSGTEAPDGRVTLTYTI